MRLCFEQLGHTLSHTIFLHRSAAPLYFVLFYFPSYVTRHSQGQAAAAASAATSAAVRAHVPVPSQDAIKDAILKRKKLALLKRLDGGEDETADDVED